MARRSVAGTVFVGFVSIGAALGTTVVTPTTVDTGNIVAPSGRVVHVKHNGCFTLHKSETATHTRVTYCEK